MSRSRHTAWVCGVIVALMIITTVLFTFGKSLGMEAASADMPYVRGLFSTDRVHTLDIVVDETQWQEMLDSASQKEYIPVNLVIDGQAVKNVGIRTKGNSSLSTLINSESDRYSFKVEFDHYQTGQTYQGLDKLALNNITQDDTYLKDYLSYQMMTAFGAEAPLSSFIYITVNGEEWGLYLAVEGIEESFAQRTYGADYGQIYKPDNMDMGGGGGGDRAGGAGMPNFAGMMDGEGEMPDFAQMFEGGEVPDFEQMFAEGGMPAPEQFQTEAGQAEETANFRGGGFFGAGPSDVALQYIDDDPQSYPNIFEESVFKSGDADHARVIEALKQLDSGEDLSSCIDTEEVLRYFVVHNFVLNFDSYTGSMLHNYYLHEKDGILSMIAWDYNLSFGGFAMGGAGGGATSLVNFPIDTPLSNGSLEDRPMIGRLLADETYMARYHELFDEFLQTFFEDGEFVRLLDEAVTLISPYVEKDPTKFCTYEDFLAAAENLRAFCLLRAESIEGQLDGTIPSTSEGQAADASALVDASSVDMDAINGSGMGGRGGGRQQAWGAWGGGERPAAVALGDTGQEQSIPMGMDAAIRPEGMAGGLTEGMPEGMPEGMSGGMPEGMPEGMPAIPSGEGMPQQTAGQESQQEPQQAQTAVPDATENAEQPPGGAETENTIEVRDRRGGMQMPGGFAGMTGGQQAEQDQSARYWLLGGSAVILLAGLCFAYFFRRR